MRIRNHVSTTAIAVAAAFTLAAVAPAEADEPVSSKIGDEAQIEAEEALEGDGVTTDQGASPDAELPEDVSSKVGEAAKPEGEDVLEGDVPVDAEDQATDVRSEEVSPKVGEDGLPLEDE